MCAVSFALGRWRGERGRPRIVRLALSICLVSYEDGYARGAELARIARDNRRTRPAPGARPGRR